MKHFITKTIELDHLGQPFEANAILRITDVEQVYDADVAKGMRFKEQIDADTSGPFVASVIDAGAKSIIQFRDGTLIFSTETPSMIYQKFTMAYGIQIWPSNPAYKYERPTPAMCGWTE
jgi:uridylate kinase